MQGAPGGVERVGLVASVSVEGQLDPTSTPVERVAGQTHHMKRIHHRDRVRSSSLVAVLRPVNPSIATTSTLWRQDCSSLRSATS